MNYLILNMNQIQKIVECALKSETDLKDLFDSAQSLLNEKNNFLIHDFLEIAHLPSVNKVISNSNKTDEWFDLLLRLITNSNYNIYALLKQRANRYTQKPLFQSISNKTLSALSYNDAWETIQSVGTFLQSNIKKNDTVGILSTNSIRSALIDLACLAYNIPVVPIPPNLSSNHLDYILTHAEISHLFIDSASAEKFIEQIKKRNTDLFISQINNDDEWKNFVSEYDKQSYQEPFKHDLNELSTIMYTSGTTDNPKGIIFNQTNIITKRFARALALPDIGPDDNFLCYLPLFHTFGRWFEMMGAIFWGATYTFTESTSFKSLLKDFKIAKPTIFISIPKRWLQIYEQIEGYIDFNNSTHLEINKIVKSITGGKLKWGLSAAGYLESDIFTFFNQNNINLLSGYGMTEATGGITMTPPNNYIRDSVGKALPGIKLKLAEDNELLMQGPYVSQGYFKEEIKSSFSNGWFHSGDIFQKKKNHYFIIDRKKEIYKNSRGQTIAPQKIENLFKDFEAIKSVFLVGDGKEFNTVLIYPEIKNETINLSEMSSKEIRTYYSSLVFSINTFLPPYERIVNYALITRDFQKSKNEITAKNTYKRKNILKNFSKIIDPMYEKSHISLIHKDYEIRIPNWLIREKSLTRRDISWDGKKIKEYGLKEGLKLTWNKNILKIGDYTYQTSITTIDLEKLFRDPNLWIGNKSLIDFTGEIIFRLIAFEPYHSISLYQDKIPFNKINHSLETRPFKKDEYNLTLLHQAAIGLLSKKKNNINNAINYFHKGLSYPNFSSIIQDQLIRLNNHPDEKIWSISFQKLIPYISGEMFVDLLKKSKNPNIISDLDLNSFNYNHLESIIILLKKYRNSTELKNSDKRISELLIDFISKLAIRKPEFYSIVRGELTLWFLNSKISDSSKLAESNLAILNKEFKVWIERNVSYKNNKLKKLIQFDINISSNLKKILDKVINESSFIYKSIFIFSNGDLIQSKDIMNDGIWCTLIGHAHGKYVVRILVQLKDKRAYNFVVNINNNLDKDRFNLETNWLILLGADIESDKLVEDFGVFSPSHQVFSEEYISGETVHQYLTRKKNEIASNDFKDRWQMRWLHYIWNGAFAYLEFWKRSGETRMIEDASTKNLIIPEFDYYTGTRLISISGRKNTIKLEDVLLALNKKLIIDTESEFKGLHKMAEWEILFTVVLEVFGVDKGFNLLKTIKNNYDEFGLTRKRIESFIIDVNQSGLLRKQVVFASLRYQRWIDLNYDATYEARGSIILDLYKDYNLHSLIDKYPETRLRFFLMTVFKDSNIELINKLNQLMIKMKSGVIDEEGLETYLHKIHDEIELTKAEKYFLTRLVFDHVNSADYAELISRDFGDKGLLDLSVKIQDSSNELFTIRPAFQPKEVANFHRVLIESKLEVQFEPIHKFLLIFNEKNILIGGVFWKKTSEYVAHLEKIVIIPDYQGKSLSTKLVKELFQRLIIKKYKYITVGFFKSELFYKLGFEINQKFGGLVKRL